MKKNKLYIVVTMAVVLLSLFHSCTPEPTYYTQVTPELFFDSQQKVYQRVGRPFTHWAWCMSNGQINAGFVKMNEVTTDELLIPTRYSDWYNNGNPIRQYTHDFSPTLDGLWDCWYLFSMGIAQTWSAKEDIDTFVDFDALGFPAGSGEAISMQLQVLAAWFYLYGLDFFGGVPLYESNQGEAKARATDVETFEFIERLVKEALPKLPKKTTLGAMETGAINQAAAAMTLARLYFNAETYIRKDMYAEAAAICQDVIDGVYGTYDLDTDWTSIFGFDNHLSPEIIWSVPSENAVSERGVGPDSSPYGMRDYWSNTTVGSRNNGYCLVPGVNVNGESLLASKPTTATEIATSGYITPNRPDGNPGTPGVSANATRLGSPFRKFHDDDVRKQLYAYEGDKKWRGMFLFGELTNPVTGTKSMGGGREVPGTDVVVLVDQIGRLTPKAGAEADHGKEGVRWGEEESGVRLTKFSPIPWETENTLKGNPDIPVLRMAEVYYMLAECKMRANDKAGAATLINKVRARYFTGADPDPVTATNLDEWRMLDEWMMEFIGEGRRRTDLIRWGKYTTEAWWDHPADGPSKAHYYRFPLPEGALSGNNLLEQNPGY